VHEPWIERFCAALHARCVAAGVCVVGGDTTAGADAVTIFLTGIVPA
jgi:thiamine monophosphate kinase